MKQKPRVAVFDFADCEGCELAIIDLEEEILDLVEIVDIVSFREAMKEHSDSYDIAIVEGSVMRPMDEKRLRSIRTKAKILVALGA
jgi:coenzyme F420-reducing hydrogenase gamma subunit